MLAALFVFEVGRGREREAAIMMKLGLEAAGKEDRGA